jgi:hypothetical protein
LADLAGPNAVAGHECLSAAERKVHRASAPRGIMHTTKNSTKFTEPHWAGFEHRMIAPRAPCHSRNEGPSRQHSNERDVPEVAAAQMFPCSDLFMNGERVVIKSHVSIWGAMISEARSHRAVIYASKKEMPCPMKI